MAEKRHGCAPERACTGIFCLEGFYISSAEENLREVFSRIFISFPVVFLIMLINQNELMGEFGIILWSA